ncbi:cytochrome P450 [Streptomyces ficellus]|uniref:Bifunctional cytochrome P450/NADPH--P450 reductase n=1 Tax=Streptomyces ficellus TaxID=1977088 RepID=A0A6I6FUS6_9ACTN|nr:cytochrome P450 [Streptomyces ficellus]QGV81256.1 cytochrome P450 [Streptomyces ficellus]
MRNDTPVPVVEIASTTSTPLQQVMDLLREHGPVIRRRLHGRDVLFVADPDLVAELCDEERFAKHVGPALENVRAFAEDGLFTAYNDEPNWARAHDVLMPAFALGSMRTYHPVMLRVARRLIRSWDAAETPVDVPEDMTRMTLDTIGLAGFGYDFASFARDEPHPFVQAMVRCLEWSMHRLGRRAGDDHDAEDAAFGEDAAYLASVVDDVITARTASGETGQDDLMGLMLGSDLDHANIRNQVITFLIAGHETTSGALAFALYHLVKHPGELRAVQREVDALWGDTDGPEPTFEEVGLLRRTRQVLNEALRLWPTAAAFSRHARVDTVLGGRIPMRAGDAATVVVPMLHRDAAVWGDNPELFDPSRFDPEAEAARPVHAYKPFGTGERACIGRQFALHEATMLLAMLVHRYRFADHDRYGLRVKETLTLKPDGFTLEISPRTERFARRAEPEAVEESAAGGPSRVLDGTGVLVLHGSNYGTCRGFAADLAAATEGIGCAAEVAPLDAYAGGLPAGRPVVVVAASYNGRPTDDAAGFTEWLEKAGAGAVDGVPYAVLGVGDRNWAATYQRVPGRVDTRLAELGGDRLVARGEADASGDLGGAVRAFTGTLLRELLDRYGDPALAGEAGGPAYTVTELTGGPLDALARRHDLVPMTVTASRSLTEPAYARVKRFVRVALPEGVTYRTADHLSVLPANPSALVERTARLLGADPDTVLSIVPAAGPGLAALAVDRPVTVRELLTHHVDLGHRPGAEALARLAALNPCPPEQAALRAVPPGTATLPDLVEAHPALREALTWPVLLELLEPMRPRTYSVSSSPAVDPGHADLMVSAAAPGTGSAHLASVRPGDTVLAGVRPCREAFRVSHGDTPLILVAAGTGLAPFRGVVADRRALAAAGTPAPAPALLYFGCDAPDADYLHGDELAAAQAEGVVSVRPAFSEAPVDGARFVQHRIEADAAELWPLLRRGARVYVCGDASRMAPGVRDAFRALYVRHTPGADDEAARTWLDRLVTDGRYVEDVYGG